MGGALFADKVVTDKTGRHIHEHLFTWYCEIRDDVSAWLNKNRHLEINRIALVVLDRFDDIIVRTKKMADRVTLGVSGISKKEEVYEICTREVSIAEAIQMFPELRDQAILVTQITN